MATGMMIDGVWTLQAYGQDAKGRFERYPTRFHGRVAADGSTPYAPAAGRYHLYVSYACPWATRTLIVRALKGLDDAISVSVVNPLMIEDGWTFAEDFPGVVPDTVNGARFLRDVYAKADPRYTGRVTVPILWDKQTGTLVNNESREILRMLDLEFDAVARNPTSYCPPELRDAIDAAIDANYDTINNGVYRAGFAATQEAYDEAVEQLFDNLRRVEDLLGRQDWLVGDRPTEADICLFPTLARFDPVYHVHFKCSVARIRDFPNLWRYAKRFYALPGVRETTRFDHIVNHYYRSHPHINPRGIVAAGPDMDALLTAP